MDVIIIKYYNNTTKNKKGLFQSDKELKFYETYLKDSGYEISIQEKFILVDKIEVNHGVKFQSLSYTPDFIVRNNGKIKHIYDVKSSLNIGYAISPVSSIKTKLLAKKIGIPVEYVVLRTHDFKASIFNATKKKILIKKNVDYNWWE